MRVKLTFSVALLVVLWMTGRRVDACSCLAPGPPCQAAWRVDAVFVGQVRAIANGTYSAETSDGKKETYPQRLVSMTVGEVFRGQVPALTVVATGMSGAECGYAFDVGKSYVVYAYRAPNGSLGTGICSRTAPVSEAAEDLAYLRALGNGKSTSATIVGEARLVDTSNDAASFRTHVPFAGGRVAVTPNDPARKDRYQAVTGKDGKFSVAVPTGSYDVALTVREGLYSSPSFFGSVEVADVRACAAADFAVMPNGRISGRVLDAEGRPVPHLSVELLRAFDLGRPAYNSSTRARTDSSGVFEFAQLPAERYALGLTLWRDAKTNQMDTVWFTRQGESDPLIATVVSEQRTSIGDAHLPESVKLTSVEGSVSWPTGKPVTTAQVYVKRADGTWGIVAGPLELDADGRFTFTVVAGRKYSLLAELLRRQQNPRVVSVESPAFVAEPGRMPPINLKFTER